MPDLAPAQRNRDLKPSQGRIPPANTTDGAAAANPKSVPMIPSTPTDPRGTLNACKRVVIKIGSKSLAVGGERFESLARQVAAMREKGVEVLIVSSGAVALGFPRLGLESRPTSVALLQASAAAGQARLMHAYEEAFSPYGIAVGQLLLTHAGLADRERYLNARAALDAMLGCKCIPIINENDGVSVAEIQFGDNDQLAAMVATLSAADLLVLLTDVEGLLDQDGQRVGLVTDVDEVMDYAMEGTGDLSRGGMPSKLESARRAARRGVPVVIADAREPRILGGVMSGKDVGTLVLPQGSPLANRKHWIAYTLRPRGSVVVDDGAVAALTTRNSSLLAAGIVGVRGDFRVGDSVAVLDMRGEEIARGLARHCTQDVARFAGSSGGDVVLHKDDLVLV